MSAWTHHLLRAQQPCHEALLLQDHLEQSIQNLVIPKKDNIMKSKGTKNYLSFSFYLCVSLVVRRLTCFTTNWRFVGGKNPLYCFITLSKQRTYSEIVVCVAISDNCPNAQFSWREKCLLHVDLIITLDNCRRFTAPQLSSVYFRCNPKITGDDSWRERHQAGACLGNFLNEICGKLHKNITEFDYYKKNVNCCINIFVQRELNTHDFISNLISLLICDFLHRKMF